MTWTHILIFIGILVCIAAVNICLEIYVRRTHNSWPPPPEETKMKSLPKSQTWRTKHGSEIPLAELTDTHLCNAMKMVARNCMRSHTTLPMRGNISQSVEYILTRNPTFKKLYDESMKRKFKTTFLAAYPDRLKQIESIEVSIPSSESRLAPGFLPSDFDSRSI